MWAGVSIPESRNGSENDEKDDCNQRERQSFRSSNGALSAVRVQNALEIRRARLRGRLDRTMKRTPGQDNEWTVGQVSSRVLVKNDGPLP